LEVPACTASPRATCSVDANTPPASSSENPVKPNPQRSSPAQPQKKNTHFPRPNIPPAPAKTGNHANKTREKKPNTKRGGTTHPPPSIRPVLATTCLPYANMQTYL
jgi:hypothetical protein